MGSYVTNQGCGGMNEDPAATPQTTRTLVSVEPLRMFIMAIPRRFN